MANVPLGVNKPTRALYIYTYIYIYNILKNGKSIKIWNLKKLQKREKGKIFQNCKNWENVEFQILGNSDKTCQKFGNNGILAS